MDIFLDDIAHQLLQRNSNDLSGICIVLPNRRAGVFLRNALSKQSNKTIWAPRILSVEDFVFSLSSLVKADQSTLLFAFYEVYHQQADDPQTIELFANWAPVFLSDINELDLNLIDAQDIFAQLYSIERIKKWNPETGTPTEIQSKHLKFVEQFFPFYEQLRAHLSSKGIGYQGMAFREVAEQIDTIVQTQDQEEVWFAGFNALTVSEERIMSGWQHSGKARMFWDMDTFYTADPVHEAGHYIRRYTSRSGTLKLENDYAWNADRLLSEKKEIHLIAAQRNIAQAAVVGSVLASRLAQNENGFTRTAVVLNDEQLLVPVLSALPRTLQGVNVTMGYNLRHAQSAVFVEQLFQLHSAHFHPERGFYHKQVVAVENDPFFRLVLGKQKVANDRKNRVYYPAEMLALSDLHRMVFSVGWHSVDGFLVNLKKLIAHVAEQLPESSLETEFLYLLDRQTQRLIDLTAEYPVIDSVRTLHTFWRQLLRTQQLDFVGEPLTGLQVLGMLETRNLDFEEVIMLSVNEGKLPSTSHAHSYFTFDVRRAYGLACQNERDAVTAYHFYRLLQRAKRVYLIYDQDTDAFGSGEVSRYVKQLLFEKGNNIKVYPWHIDQKIPSSVVAPEISMPKGENELDRLRYLAQKGLSPSALNTFRNCPLKYFFRYVAGVKEPDQFEEDMDAAKFGSAVHATLQELYTPFIGKALHAEALEKLAPMVRNVLEKQFKKELRTDEPLSGADLLAFEVGVAYINRVIQYDRRTVQNGQALSIVALEEKLSRKIQVSTPDGEIEVDLIGTADRVDRTMHGTLRIIDYKTGAFDPQWKKLNISHVEDFESSKTDIAFQLLCYLYLASEKWNTSQLISEAFFLRSKQVEFPVSVSEDKQPVEGQELMDYTESLLSNTLTALFDREIAFTQTEDPKVCGFCEFNDVCQRSAPDN